MPEGTPFTKVGHTEGLGATVVLAGARLAEARAVAFSQCEEQGQVKVSAIRRPQ